MDTLYFRKERETKGAVVYRELDAQGTPILDNRNGSIGSLYIRKTAPICQDGIPSMIAVVVEKMG